MGNAQPLQQKCNVLYPYNDAILIMMPSWSCGYHTLPDFYGHGFVGDDAQQREELRPSVPSDDRCHPYDGVVESSRWFRRIPQSTMAQLYGSVAGRSARLGLEGNHSSDTRHLPRPRSSSMTSIHSRTVRSSRWGLPICHRSSFWYRSFRTSRSSGTARAKYFTSSRSRWMLRSSFDKARSYGSRAKRRRCLNALGNISVSRSL